MAKPAKNKGLGWRFYLLIYVVYAGGAAFSYFTPGSTAGLFYQTLAAFDHSYLLPMILHESSLVLNVLSVIPYLLFTEGIPLLTARLWRIFFFARLVAESSGNLYAIKQLQAIFVDAPRFAVYSVAAVLIILVPSYVALYRLGWGNEVKRER